MRDFRDAKVMAHALRDALKAKIVETIHSECLELIAKNWNILSAKIDAAQPHKPGRPAASSTDPVPHRPRSIARCAAKASTRFIS